MLKLFFTNQNYLVVSLLAITYCICKEQLYSEWAPSLEHTVISGCFGDVEMLLVV